MRTPNCLHRFSRIIRLSVSFQSKLGKQLEANEITQDEYNDKVKELKGPMMDYYDALMASIGASDTFLTSFNNMDLNFENYDTLISSLDEIGKAYKSASDAIDNEVRDIQSNFEVLLASPTITDSQRALYEELIEQAEK